MALAKYGVLKCKLSKNRNGKYYQRESGNSSHVQMRCEDGNGTLYRIAVNVQPQESSSEQLIYANEKFRNSAMIAQLSALGMKYTLRKAVKAAPALDYIRGGLFKKSAMKKLPPNLPGTDNNLSYIFEKYALLAVANPDARRYVFGAPWGPEEGVKDKIFSFTPGRGVHDVHMNQRNSPRYAKDDGTWQDGGLIMDIPSHKVWIDIVLAFQSQSFITNDTSGYALTSNKASLASKKKDSKKNSSAKTPPTNTPQRSRANQTAKKGIG